MIDSPAAAGSSPTETAHRISVVIPVFDSMKYLGDSLPSIVSAIAQYGDAELILVDNGSTDGSFEFMQSEYGKRATIMQIPGVTIATLRNRGAQAATGEFISFIDSDCVVPPAYFNGAMQVFHSVTADAAGCECELPHETQWLEETWYLLHLRRRDGYVPYIYAANFMVRRSVFERVGGFDESLVTDEDAEIGLRLTSMGFKIYRTEQIPAIHLGNPKTISSFFRKEVWHSQGMFATVGLSWFDKTLLVSLADFSLMLAGLLLLFFANVPVKWRLAGLLVTVALAPLLTVAYRTWQRGAVYRPLRSLFLYRLYFAARIYALFKLGLRRLGRGKQQSRQTA